MQKSAALFALTIMVTIVLSLSVSGAAATLQDPCPDVNHWNGSVNENWGNVNNWDCGVVPDKTTAVISKVNSGNYPVVPTSIPLVMLKDLKVKKDASFNLNGRTLIISGDLENDGTLIDTQFIPEGGVFPFKAFYFDVGGYGGLTLSRKLAFDLFDPNPVTVRIKGDQFCDNGNSTVKRCFDITPTIAENISINAVFYFAPNEVPEGMNCLKLTAFHWHNKSWVPAGSNVGNDCLSTLNSPNFSVSVDNITRFSPFAISEGAPTAVSILNFNAAQERPASLLVLFSLFIVTAFVTFGIVILRKLPNFI